MSETEPTRTNGAELDDRQKRALDFTFAEHLAVKGELEDARAEIGELRQQLTQNAVEIEGLRSLRNHFENMMHEYAAKCDAATARCAKFAALLSVIATALDKAAMDDFIGPDTGVAKP